MVDIPLYFCLIALVGVERLLELRIAKRNASLSFAVGGIETGQSHYPFMVVLHSLFLFGCLFEVWFFRETEKLWQPVLGWTMLVLAVLAQGLRWWVIRTLGTMWNTRIIVIPNAPRVTTGPFRFLTHPNYLAVAIEGFALPLIGSAWITATVFTVANALLMKVRIRSENQALSQLDHGQGS